jgi:hypothetical protein
VRKGFDIMVKGFGGWTAKGDSYWIVGGKSYIKENGCYDVVFDSVSRVHELWRIPAKDLTIEELKLKLEGLSAKGPFGRNFLVKYGERIGQPTRLPPK